MHAVQARPSARFSHHFQRMLEYHQSMVSDRSSGVLASPRIARFNRTQKLSFCHFLMISPYPTDADNLTASAALLGLVSRSAGLTLPLIFRKITFPCLT